MITSSTISPGRPTYETGHIDFVTATHHVHEILKTFQDDMQQRARHSFGYANANEDSRGIVVAWGHPFSSAGQISFPGRALEILRVQGQEREVLTRLNDCGARVTRVDLARNTSGVLTPHYLERAVRAGRVDPKYTGFEPRGRISEDAFSMKAGSRQRNSLLRIYRKDVLLRSKGIDCNVSPLTRWELEVRREAAPALFHELLALPEEVDPETGEVVWPVIRIANRELSERVRIFATREDKEKGSKGKLARNWTKFIAMSQPVARATQILESHPAKEFEAQVRWATQTVGPVLSQILAAGGAEAVLACARGGADRGRPDLRAFVQADPSTAAKIIRDVLGPDLRPESGGGR